MRNKLILFILLFFLPTLLFGQFKKAAFKSGFSGGDVADSTTFLGPVVFTSGFTVTSGLVTINVAVTINATLDLDPTATTITAVYRVAHVQGTLTTTSGTGDVYGLQVAPKSVTINSGNVHPVVASVFISEPDITETSGSVTTAASLYIESAPTEGTGNGALIVASGNVGFGETNPTGNLHIKATNNLFIVNEDLTDGATYFDLGAGGQTNGVFRTAESVAFIIDSDNGQTDRTFTVNKDNTDLQLVTELFRVQENGAVTQETFVITKVVSLTGATDNTATNFFTITTTDETGSADGGSYMCYISLLASEGVAASGATNVASRGLEAHFTRVMASAGTGSNSAMAAIDLAAEAAEGTGNIITVTLTIVETSEFIQTVQLLVDTSGGTFDGFAEIRLVYNKFTTAPVIAGI